MAANNLVERGANGIVHLVGNAFQNNRRIARHAPFAVERNGHGDQARIAERAAGTRMPPPFLDQHLTVEMEPA